MLSPENLNDCCSGGMRAPASEADGASFLPNSSSSNGFFSCCASETCAVIHVSKSDVV